MGLEELLPPVILELRAKATELHAELGKVKGELEEMDKKAVESGGKMSSAFDKTAKYGQTLTKGVIGIGGAVGGFAVEAAMSAEVVDAKLRTAIQNAGGSMEELEPKINKLDAAQRKYGFTNDQTNTALATLTTALHNPEKAMEAMSVAADLSRAKNIDLNTASLLVAKAMEGQTRPLKALGIDLATYTGGAQNTKLAQDQLTKAQMALNDILKKTPDAAKPASKAHAQYEKALLNVKLASDKLHETQDAGNRILDAVEGRVKGAANAYGHTLRGQIDSARAGVENMGESLGKTLIPWINKAIQVGVKLVGFLTNQGKPILYAIAGVIGVMMVAGIVKWVAELTRATVETAAKFGEWLGRAIASTTGITQRLTSLGTTAQASAAQQVAASEEAAGAAEASAATQEEAAAAVEVADESMAATAEAAGAATYAAGGPVTMILGLIVMAATLLMTHWKEVWSALCTAAKWAYDNVLKPVGHFIVDLVVKPIEEEVALLERGWHIAWSAIGDAISWVHNNIISPIARGIHAVINDVAGGIAEFQIGWHDAWTAVGDVLSWIYNHTIGPIVNLVKDAIGWVSSAVNTVSSVASKVGGIFGLHFADGGPVPGAPGQPHLAVVHGGEYVLSQAMLAGRQEPTGLDKMMGAPSPSAAALSGAGPSTAAPLGSPSVVVMAQTNASPSQIASSVGWELRKRAS